MKEKSKKGLRKKFREKEELKPRREKMATISL